MTPEQWREVKSVLQRALEIGSEDRPAYLDAQSVEVRREVESLLHAYEQNGAFLEMLCVGAGGLPRPDSDQRGKRFGPYQTISLLGEGGTGSVWLAERIDGLFARKVALKLVHPALMGRVMTERVAREREILASLHHSNIAQLFDAGFAEDGQPYLALEYICGTPLTKYCDERCLSIHERLALFQQVLSAVQYAHAHLVVHRDLKPSNILVSDDGQIHLLDFGIAKLLTEGQAKETQLTRLGGRALTPDYAAPEQITGAPITTATDVYALGVVLYELLAGVRPYRLKRDSLGALEDAIVQTEPMPPSRVTPTETSAQARATAGKKLPVALGGELDAITMKALKKSPTERYSTASEFGEDVARFLRGEVVVAQADSVAYRASKFARRHRVAIAGVAILILTLAVGLVATSYEAEVASTQRDAALQAQLRSLTQTATARLKDGDISSALGILLEIMPRRGVQRTYTDEAVSVFQGVQAVDVQVLIISGHTDRVRSVAFSPDGRRIVSASLDRTARVWDSAIGRQSLVLRGHTDGVTSAAFSPDGRKIVTGSFDKTARIWDAATGIQTMIFLGHTERVRSVAFSPDGRQVVTGSFDKTARIWDAATGQELLRLNGHTDRVTCAAFSPDGRQVVTASEDRTARIWDARTGREIRRFSAHGDRVWSAAFSPDGRRIVTASNDKTARIWDAATGRELRLLSGHLNQLASATFSPDGQRVLTTSADDTARIWDAATGREIGLLNGHTALVEAGEFSPDGRNIVTGSYDNTVRIWHIPKREIMVLNGHTDQVWDATFSSDGHDIATASQDRTARIWDAATGKELARLSGHADLLTSVAYSADGQRLVTASNDKTARVWDCAKFQEISVLRGHTELLESAAFSPDGQRVVTASYDKTARIWDALTGREMVQLRGHTAPLESAAFSPDGRRVVTASQDNTARIWDAETGQEIIVLNGHTSYVNAAAFSPDGRRVVTSSGDNTARIWDSRTGRQIMVLTVQPGHHTARIARGLFSPDGKRIVTVSTDNTVHVWDVEIGQEILRLSGFTDVVTAASFSPDGSRIVTASQDKTARIWDVRTVPLDLQISWAAAAQLDPLSGTERFQLGLPALSDERQWPFDQSKCDQSAAAPYDPDRHGPGVVLERIDGSLAIPACASDMNTSDNRARSVYQHGRALASAGYFAAAKQDFEEALAKGYRGAGVDLALMLSRPSAGIPDIRRAIALFEQAWADGVKIAAYELGGLYERGVGATGENGKSLLNRDDDRAWYWYQKAVDTGEPNALARFAEWNDSASSSEVNSTRRNSYLLASFKYYAAASEQARHENWPDDAWRSWRYHRASLARLLAREGMTEQVARTYEEVRRRYAPREPTVWERLRASLRSGAKRSG